jgi:inosine-uridine nucleoside N-ribohydrolase
MGGAYYRQYADWNVMCDVEAADVMFRGLRNLECVGADVTHQTVLCREEHEAMLSCQKDAAAVEIAELIRLWSVVNPERYPTLHDPLAVYYAVHPEVCDVEKQRIAVLTDGYARGLTLNVDAYNKAYMNPACGDIGDTDGVVVAKNIDARAFINTFINIFR